MVQEKVLVRGMSGLRGWRMKGEAGLVRVDQSWVGGVEGGDLTMDRYW